MANDFVAVTDGTGSKIDTTLLTVGANQVERQRVVIGDDVAAGQFARITAAGELVTASADQSVTGNITAADVASATATGASNQSIITGTPTAGSVFAAAVSGDSSFALQITGIWVGTLQFERSLDGGATWTSVGAFAAGTAVIGPTTTSNGMWHGNASAATNVRVRATAWTSGTASVVILAGAGTGTITVGNPVRLVRDVGRSGIALYMTVPVVTTATDTLQSLTGYAGSAAVAATTTPAIVGPGRTRRLNQVVLTYVAVAAAGAAKLTLRANPTGVVAIGSPAVCSWIVGGPAAAAGVSQTVALALPDGMDFAAGTGLGVSMQGLSATQTAAAAGYGHIVLHGFDY